MKRPPFIWISTGGAAMVDYSMCCQTVTVYRNTAEGILRQVIPGCFLQWEDRVEQDADGIWQKRAFLLIQPGQQQLVFPGDKVWEGIGPEVAAEDWEAFIPASVVNYAKVYRWEGKFCHTEAGRAYPNGGAAFGQHPLIATPVWQ